MSSSSHQERSSVSSNSSPLRTKDAQLRLLRACALRDHSPGLQPYLPSLLGLLLRTLCAQVSGEKETETKPTPLRLIIASSSHHSTSRKKLSWFPVPFHSFHSTDDYCIPPHPCPTLEVTYDQPSVHLCSSSLKCSPPVASPFYLLSLSLF